MADIKNLKLTQDPLTNIGIMVPMLDDRAREAVSYLMYGCCLGESIANGDQKERKELAVRQNMNQQDKQLQEA